MDKWDKHARDVEQIGIMEQLNLRELEAVIAIARRGTFRAAAIDLGMSTTALSHTIGRLEAGLGVRLFNRTTRSVSLTDAGRLFVQQVAPSLQDLHAALETVRSQRETPVSYTHLTLPTTERV